MMRVLIQNLNDLGMLICIKIFRWKGKRTSDLLMYIASRFGDGYGIIACLILILDFDTAQKLLSASNEAQRDRSLRH